MDLIDIIGIVLIGDGVLSIALSEPTETYRLQKQFGRLLRIGIGGYLVWTKSS